MCLKQLTEIKNHCLNPVVSPSNLNLFIIRFLREFSPLVDFFVVDDLYFSPVIYLLIFALDNFCTTTTNSLLIFIFCEIFRIQDQVVECSS